MTVKELRGLINQGEDSKTQLKRQFDGVDAVASEIAAMANSEGGKVIVGVSNQGEIAGVERLHELNQWISNACSQKIEPPASVITELLKVDGKRVMVIRVAPGTDKPYAVDKTTFWVKVGADKRRATREELCRLVQASGVSYADEVPVATTDLDDFDQLRFRLFYKDQYGMEIESLNLNIDRILSNLKLIKDLNLTIAGLLLFGNELQRIRPQCVVKAVAFDGNSPTGTAYLDSEDIGFTLSEQFKNTMGFLNRNLHKLQRGQNFNSTGKWEVPKVALEEAVANALIHRDYLISSSIRVFVFEDRVEIISPGRLPNTATIESIKAGIQIVRNPILASFAPKLGFPYRGLGTGVPRMIEECRNANLPEPQLIEDKTGEVFRVIFHRPASSPRP